MPRTRKPPPPPEIYEVQINPNTLALALESALQSATAPLYEEISKMRQEILTQQSTLVKAIEQMKHSHTEQLQRFASSLSALQQTVDDVPNE